MRPRKYSSPSVTSEDYYFHPAWWRHFSRENFGAGPLLQFKCCQIYRYPGRAATEEIPRRVIPCLGCGLWATSSCYWRV
ncbi:unnamed protein product [Ixodes pacificus]